MSGVRSSDEAVTPKPRSHSPSPVPHLGNVHNQVSRPSEPSELNSALTNVEVSKLGPRTSEPFNVHGYSVNRGERSHRDEADTYTVGLENSANRIERGGGLVRADRTNDSYLNLTQAYHDTNGSNQKNDIGAGIATKVDALRIQDEELLEEVHNTKETFYKHDTKEIGTLLGASS